MKLVKYIIVNHYLCHLSFLSFSFLTSLACLLKLYFKSEGEGKRSREGKKKGDYSLVFLLDFTALGALRMDAKISENKLAVNISAENAESVAFINKRLPLLKTKLEALGFETEATCCELKNDAMEIEDPLTRLLIDNHTSLVDLKT